MELYKIVLYSGRISREIYEKLAFGLRQLPSLVTQVLDNEKQIIDCAEFLTHYSTVFYIGRGINYPIALEGALKLKEIAYIHAEGYAAGELKHGPFALLDKNTPVIAIATQGNVYSSMVNTIKEIKARQSPVVVLADTKCDDIESFADVVIQVPCVADLLSPVINVIPLQLLAYHTAKNKGCPIDYPRNLAKSVTVE
jgi:glutamine---fructose-6-phosphate transaminase (isomerizing)